MTHPTLLRWRALLADRAGALLIVLAGLSGFAATAHAQDFALIDMQGEAVSLDTWREDGKWTLFMIRYEFCAQCDKGERELQEWFAAQDKSEVSVLALNIDDGEETLALVRERLETNRIGYPNVLTRDTDAFSAAYRELTERRFSGVPSWLFFGPDGRFLGVDVGADFDWESLDEMIAAAPAGLPSLQTLAGPFEKGPPVPERSLEDARSNIVVNAATIALMRGDIARAGRWLDDELVKNPGHLGLLAERARYLMLEGREPADAPLGYRLSEKTDAAAAALLAEVLERDDTHVRATYLLAELHATQGRLAEAERAIGVLEELDVNARHLSYARAVHRIMQGRNDEAVELLHDVADRPFRGADQFFLFQQAWERLKGVVMKHPELDPLPLVREGLVTRVDSGSLLEEIERRSDSETPLLVIATSEDPNCSYCVDNGKKVEPFLRANEGKYNVIYTSVEPWRNIAFEPWAQVVPDALAVPKGILFARSRYMVTGGLPIGDAQIAWYEQMYPRMLAETPKRWDYPKRQAKGEFLAAYQRWLKADLEVTAFARTVDDDRYAWGSSDARDVTRTQADEAALAMCAERATAKGIDKPCTLFVPKKE